MKTCPNCAAANRDDVAVCYKCGSELTSPPGSPASAPWEQQGSTQPVRARAQDSAPPPGPSHPYPGSRASAGRSSSPRGQVDYNPPSQNPAGSYHPGATRPMQPGTERGQPEPPLPSGGYGPSYSPPEYEPYAPPVAESHPESRPGQFWTALVAVLVLALLCGGVLALWTMLSAAYGGVYGAGAQISTQAAQVFEPSAPVPTATPEPTWTPEGVPTPTLNATQESTVKKLLSPECSGALDRLSSARDQLVDNPAVPFDAAWREELNQAIEQVRASCGSPEAASPVPGIVSQAQKDLTQAQSEFDQANRLFKEGTSEWNPRKILEAGGHVISAGKYLDSAITELGKITP